MRSVSAPSSATAKGFLLAVVIPLTLHGLLAVAAWGLLKSTPFDSVAFTASTLRMTMILVPALSVVLLPVHFYCRARGLIRFRDYAAGIFLLANILFLFVKPEITPGFGTMTFNTNLLCAPLIAEARREAPGSDEELFQQLEKDTSRPDPSGGWEQYQRVESPWPVKLVQYDPLISGFLATLSIIYAVSFMAGFVFWRVAVYKPLQSMEAMG